MNAFTSFFAWKRRRLTKLADGMLPATCLGPEETAYVAEQEKLRSLLSRAYENAQHPRALDEEAFIAALKRRGDATRGNAEGARNGPARGAWAMATLVAAALVALFALVYLFAPDGRPVKASPIQSRHPEMERPAEASVALPETPDAPGRPNGPNRDL